MNESIDKLNRIKSGMYHTGKSRDAEMQRIFGVRGGNPNV
jgi:hypothetical protein